MTIFDRVRKLNFPIGKYVVVGSGVLEAHGIREAKDIDIVILYDFWTELLHRGWGVCLCEKHKNSREETLVNPLQHDEIEIRLDLSVGKFRATADHLIKGADIIDSIPFAKVEEILKWKQEAGRDKDIDDIKLIENYLAKTK